MATCRLAIKVQGGVGFAEVVMRANLDRTIARIANGQCSAGPPHIQFDVAIVNKQFTGDDHQGLPEKKEPGLDAFMRP
jgi:hypothetical protein